MPEPDPVLFVSHRWESSTHPDPDGRQLEKLKALPYSVSPCCGGAGAEVDSQDLAERADTISDKDSLLARLLAAATAGAPGPSGPRACTPCHLPTRASRALVAGAAFANPFPPPEGAYYPLGGVS